MAHINITKKGRRATTIATESSGSATVSPGREHTTTAVPDPPLVLANRVSVTLASTVAASSDLYGSDVAVGDDTSSEAFDVLPKSKKSGHDEAANPQTDPTGHHQSSSAETHCTGGFGGRNQPYTLACSVATNQFDLYNMGCERIVFLRKTRR
ncbi:hypothetical protein P171DRAFT_490549 [Karstenula rhodostoma CBS 690.94]|uniref:Uncharacterized protein n=1 Tax=Karstenula rhodostoma CBS 690.94 TaxID=1392251 RepID=A0A9P4P9F3_9PLEO|nr:hypothetical protein P171DRAFT_490549 [Karstenula rhodostoma CBS 690.94]